MMCVYVIMCDVCVLCVCGVYVSFFVFVYFLTVFAVWDCGFLNVCFVFVCCARVCNVCVNCV